MDKRIAAYVVAALFMAGACDNGDAPTRHAGDVTETCNAFVAGKLVNSTGAAVGGARVMLIPEYYNPVQDSGLFDSLALTDSTDSDGWYRFAGVPAGLYNIQGAYTDDFGALITGIEAVDGDSVERGTDTLYWNGVMEVAVDSTDLDEDGFLYIPGTDIFTRVDSLALSRGRIRIDHLPPGAGFDIRYFRPDDRDSLIFHDVSVHPDDTTLCPGDDCPPPPPPEPH